jgi:hypothetical protein
MTMNNMKFTKKKHLQYFRIFHFMLAKSHDTQNNDTQHNDTQHNDSQHK